MKKLHPVIIIIMFVSGFFVSCNKKDDTINEPPEITILHPVDNDTVKAGGSFEMEIVLSDAGGLHQCVVEVHNNFDNHTHQAAKNAEITGEPWLYHRGYTFYGETSQTLHEVINVPLLIGNEPIARGKYHFYVTIEDIQGLMVLASKNIIIGG